MLKRLQQKWKVSPIGLLMILCTFAIGGSATGLLAKKIMTALGVEQTWLWILLYILLLTFIWPLAVLVVSIPFGQFSFFKNYTKRILQTAGLRKIEPGVRHDDPARTRIAIFASGAGSNAQKIIDRFRQHPLIKVSLIVCNKPGAGVLGIAEKENIPSLLIDKEKFYGGNGYVDEIKKTGIDFIVLAGFLWKIPGALLNAFPKKIINIHPALLPRFGGQGMYGHKVHEAVIAAGEKESGITIHFADEIYDHGQIIFQATCPVLSNDTAATLAQKILRLEHEHFSSVVEALLLK